MHYLLLIISIVFVVPSVFAQVDNSLVLHFEFENNVEDTSTYENDGVINSEVTYTDGIIGKAIMLSGSNSDYIYLGHYYMFDADFIQGNISIASWVKGSSYWVFSSHNCSGIYAFQFVDGFVKFVFSKNWGDDIVIKTDESINDEEFHHIAVTTENNIFRIYIDGIMVKEESHDVNRLSWCSQTEFNSNGVLINACSIKPNSNPPIPGWGPYPDQTIYLDDLRVYNRTMSDTEILQLFEMKNQFINSSTMFGKIITSSEILGYTASVGGATIKALPYNLSTVTNIYGDYQLSNIPEGECIIQIESSYFQTLTKSIQLNTGDNFINAIEIFKPKCQNMYTQQEVDHLLGKVQSEKDEIILEKEETINQLNASIATMYTQGDLDKAIAEAEKRGELKYDINNDGKVGLEEIIKYLETISGVRVESLIIFPDNEKHFLSE